MVEPACTTTVDVPSIDTSTTGCDNTMDCAPIAETAVASSGAVTSSAKSTVILSKFSTSVFNAARPPVANESASRCGGSVFATSAEAPTGTDTMVPPFPSGAIARSAIVATSLRELRTANISTAVAGISNVATLSTLFPPDACNNELVPMNKPLGKATTDKLVVTTAAIIRLRRRAGIAVIVDLRTNHCHEQWLPHCSKSRS
ncbi:unannotated protein [freshwater metagenome]|uniref:Unannotated protein n=1 Tax=freshwater metagenome TaxID=449393 RepID=A0A6J6AFT4_9ZZZZ